MWTYLLIVLVIALALAPLSHFLPSKQQRKQARLREYAAVHGLFVEFRDAPSLAGTQRPSGQVIYYGKRIPATLATRISPAAWVRAADGWLCVNGRIAAPSPMEALAANIFAASIDACSCGVYWTESGEEEDVERIRQALADWSELIGD